MRKKFRLRALLRSLVQDASGGVAIIFAVSLTALLMFIGIAIDFGGASSTKTKLQIQTDTALLAAAHTYLDTSDIDKVTLEINTFLKGSMPGASLEAPPYYVEARSELCAKTKTTYQVLMMSIFGFGDMPVRNEGCVRVGKPEYIDFYIVMDNTPSMGLGATITDIENLMKATYNTRPDGKRGCAFACHFSDTQSGYANFRTNQLAKAGYDITPLSNSLDPNTTQLSTSVVNAYLANPVTYASQKGLTKLPLITLRIDVVQKAVENLLTTAKQKQKLPSQYRFAVYHFGKDCRTSALTPVNGLATPVDVDTARDALNKNPVTLMDALYPGFNAERCTSFTNVFNGLNSGTYKIPDNGNGSVAQRKKFVFFVSDGTTDTDRTYPCEARSATKYTAGKIPSDDATRCLSPIDVSRTCDLLKTSPRKINIAALYTTYLPLDNTIIGGTQNDFYYNNIRPFNAGPYAGPYFAESANSKINQFMKECASPGYFFEVSPTSGINEAMQALFAKAIAINLSRAK